MTLDQADREWILNAIQETRRKDLEALGIIVEAGGQTAKPPTATSLIRDGTRVGASLLGIGVKLVGIGAKAVVAAADTYEKELKQTLSGPQ